MYITITQETKDAIIAYARQIAVYRQYPILINGLQPVEDYEVACKQYPGLRAKLAHELQEELREAYANWQSGRGKTQWHVMHEAVDCLYYAFQIEEQTGASVWPGIYQSVRLYTPLKWNESHIELAALAKYAYRASAPNRKDEVYELALIEAALQ